MLYYRNFLSEKAVEAAGAPGAPSDPCCRRYRASLEAPGQRPAVAVNTEIGGTRLIRVGMSASRGALPVLRDISFDRRPGAAWLSSPSG